MPEVEIAKDQDQYLTLPAMVSRGYTGVVTTRWNPSLSGRFRLLFGGSVYVQMLCFGKPVTPLRVTVDEPPIDECCG